MAEGKKGFILYADLLTVVEKLVIKDRQNKTNYGGELFLCVLLYVNDKNPVPIDFIVEMAFEPIKLSLKRDLIKFDAVKIKRSEAGKKSAELRALKKAQQNSTNPTSVESVEIIPTNPTVSVNDNVNVNESVTDNTMYIPSEVKNTQNFTEEYFLQRWRDARNRFDKQPTLFKKLIQSEKIDFAELKKDYGKKEFDQAMQGLFQQKTFPTIRLRPSHFLRRENFETYLTCFVTKEKLFEDNKYKKAPERL